MYQDIKGHPFELEECSCFKMQLWATYYSWALVTALLIFFFISLILLFLPFISIIMKNSFSGFLLLKIYIWKFNYCKSIALSNDFKTYFFSNKIRISTTGWTVFWNPNKNIREVVEILHADGSVLRNRRA